MLVEGAAAGTPSARGTFSILPGGGPHRANRVRAPGKLTLPSQHRGRLLCAWLASAFSGCALCSCSSSGKDGFLSASLQPRNSCDLHFCWRFPERFSMTHFFPPRCCDLHNNTVRVSGQSYEYSEKDSGRFRRPFLNSRGRAPAG